MVQTNAARRNLLRFMKLIHGASLKARAVSRNRTLGPSGGDMNTIRLEEDFIIPGVFGRSATTKSAVPWSLAGRDSSPHRLPRAEQSRNGQLRPRTANA